VRQGLKACLAPAKWWGNEPPLIPHRDYSKQNIRGARGRAPAGVCEMPKKRKKMTAATKRKISMGVKAALRRKKRG